MRIEGKPPFGAARVEHLAAEKEKFAASKVSRGPAADELTLSREARLRQELLARLRSLPEVREELVADIRRRMAGGAYAVEEEELAAAIVREIQGQ